MERIFKAHNPKFSTFFIIPLFPRPRSPNVFAHFPRYLQRAFVGLGARIREEYFGTSLLTANVVCGTV